MQTVLITSVHMIVVSVTALHENKEYMVLMQRHQHVAAHNPQLYNVYDRGHWHMSTDQQALVVFVYGSGSCVVPLLLTNS